MFDDSVKKMVASQDHTGSTNSLGSNAASTTVLLLLDFSPPSSDADGLWCKCQEYFADDWKLFQSNNGHYDGDSDPRLKSLHEAPNLNCFRAQVTG